MSVRSSNVSLLDCLVAIGLSPLVRRVNFCGQVVEFDNSGDWRGSGLPESPIELSPSNSPAEDFSPALEVAL